MTKLVGKKVLTVPAAGGLLLYLPTASYCPWQDGGTSQIQDKQEVFTNQMGHSVLYAYFKVLTSTAAHAFATIRPVAVVVAFRVDARGTPQFRVRRRGRRGRRAGVERGALVREREDAP